ncbi:MAG TPA: adenylyl-sulfate kinase [bacterium (Candidatus Stahlbacteria)]|nr:adenylyl-sulfate kinase [Candidatus Stahlbacteria bacterium]
MSEQEGFAIWITGLPGSGKSVVSDALKDILNNHKIGVQILRTDKLRKIMTPHPKYTEEERELVYNMLVYVGELLTTNGINVIFDATGNRRQFRNNARNKIKKFMEVYLNCPLDICMKRESSRKKLFGAPKQIYRRAMKGEATTVPGLQVPYEEPINPELTLDTNELTQDECAKIIFNKASKLFALKC